MEIKVVTFKLLLIITIVCAFKTLSAQDYRTDSLQIKVYTVINYTAGRPTRITLKKVFCDYCTKIQLESLAENALRRTELEKNDPKNRLKDGKKKLALYIRIAKKDFAAIREEE